MTEPIQAVTALATSLNQDAIATWSDEKRKDFVRVFEDRVRATRYILLATANIVLNRATEKQFITQYHIQALRASTRIPDQEYDKGHHVYRVGGRPSSELDEIAKAKADEIISKLPGLSAAVRIISPAIAADIEKKNNLRKKGTKLFEETEILAQPVNMAELDQTMSLGDFREFVRKRDRDRRRKCDELDEIGKEIKELETRINAFLYKGLPGLSDAVIDVVKSYVEQVTAFDTLNRRVAEKVLFGDSEAALDLLRGFEKDEVEVSEGIKAKFDAALEVLKVSSQTRKAIPTPVKKTNRRLK